MIEALLYKKLKNKAVACYACSHQCLILEGKRGICRVRENQKGKLYSLVYGKAIAAHLDPIEKKPFFHFLLGSYSLSIATVGCNFKCLHCQNSDISQMPKDNQDLILGEDLSPEKIVERAIKEKAPSISYTYTEPTIFLEYALETMKLAKNQGLKNNWVTNGYMSQKTLKLIAPYLDAANLDLKFFKDVLYQKISGAKLQPVLDSLVLMKKLKIWVEVTTLAIPGYTDQGPENIRMNQFEDIAKFIKNKLGAETPWHISRFYPAYKMSRLSPTPVETIQRAYQVGKKTGLKYVYTGNIPNHQGENTYCPNCNHLVIERFGYEIVRFDKNGFCPKCQTRINLVLK